MYLRKSIISVSLLKFSMNKLSQKTASVLSPVIVAGMFDADSLLGGKVAVVPVLLFEVKPEVKKLNNLIEVDLLRLWGYEHIGHESNPLEIR